MIMIPISRLRENLVGFLKRVEEGEDVVVTSRGRKVARITSLENTKSKDGKVLRQLRKTSVIKDIMMPLKEDWKVMQ